MSLLATYKPDAQTMGRLFTEPLAGLEKIAFRYHGVGVHLYGREDNLRWLQESLPRSWWGCDHPELTLVWRLAEERLQADDPFFSFDDPEITQRPIAGAPCAWQRDFIGSWVTSSRAEFVTGEARDDGFFNAMRWIMPPRLVHLGKYLMHGAAILGDGEGLLFIGPSGSGKTTTANKAPAGVMGDDMAILTMGTTTPVIEAAFLGQGSEPDINPGVAFPLKTIMRLQQGEFSRRPCNGAEAMRHVLGSLHQPVWTAMSAQQTEIILGDVSKLVQRVPVFTLTCRKEDQWETLVHGL